MQLYKNCVRNSDAVRTARKRFNDNKKHLIEGEDYFKICANEIRTHKIMELSPKVHEDLTLMTESGYLMLKKSNCPKFGRTNFVRSWNAVRSSVFILYWLLC